MARSRNIKPSFFKNEHLIDLQPLDRLLFIGLWTLADREGRLEDRPRRIKIELFPGDTYDVDVGLDNLEGKGFIERYEVDSEQYIQVEAFTKHQKPHHKEIASDIPAPPGRPQVTRHAYDVSNETRLSVFERDGNQCLKCGAEEGLSLDHIKPLAKGGDNSTENLQTLCTSCNSAKGDATKDYRRSIDDSSLNHAQGNDGAPCPSDSLSLDSLNLIPDSLTPLPPEGEAAGAASDQGKPAPKTGRKKRDPAFDPLSAKPTNVSAETWARWVQHRKEIRKPLTPTSCSQQAAQLATCPNPDAVIAKSIASGWQGLFPDKEVRGQAAKPSSFTNLPKHNADPNSEEPDHDGPNF